MSGIIQLITLLTNFQEYFVIIIPILIMLLVVIWFSIRIKNYKRKLFQKQTEIDYLTNSLLQKESLYNTGKVASSIMHEIKSPVGAILNSAQRLSTNGNYNNDQKENLQLILTAAEKSKSIITGVLSSAGNNNLVEEVCINNIITDWKILYQKEFEADGIKTSFNLEKNIYLSINHIHLLQVFTNLLNNSRDSLSTTQNLNKKITVTGKINNQIYHLCFQDNGHGFTKKIIESGIEPFTTTKGNRNGLGLYISKKIIEKNHGFITIENNKEGAVVTVGLKLKKLQQ